MSILTHFWSARCGKNQGVRSVGDRERKMATNTSGQDLDTCVMYDGYQTQFGPLLLERIRCRVDCGTGTEIVSVAMVGVDLLIVLPHQSGTRLASALVAVLKDGLRSNKEFL